MITQILDKIDSVMYYPILIIVMALAGIYFTILTKGVEKTLSRVGKTSKRASRG